VLQPSLTPLLPYSNTPSIGFLGRVERDSEVFDEWVNSPFVVLILESDSIGVSARFEHNKIFLGQALST
jgi:hypothetical protein